MNEELEQIEKNNTWELVPRPHDKNICYETNSRKDRSTP